MNTLIQKLKLRPGEVALVQLPKELVSDFKSIKHITAIPKGTTHRLDFVLLFALNSHELNAFWKPIDSALKETAVFWVGYPKMSSGISSDLAGMTGDWAACSGSSWQPVASVSINETWTGVRFKYSPNLAQIREERPAENICDSDGSLVVNRAERQIHLPKDLAQLLSRYADARLFFETLSFTNKKEYVLWIVEAKKTETRAARLKLALNKLVSGKKNPSEK